LAFPYWIDNLGFITEGKLAAIFIKPSLGVFNWPVIYFINYTPTSSLAPFNTAPSELNKKFIDKFKKIDVLLERVDSLTKEFNALKNIVQYSSPKGHMKRL
jgi:hypothetical protein